MDSAIQLLDNWGLVLSYKRSQLTLYARLTGTRFPELCMYKDRLPTIWLLLLCKQIGKPVNTALRRPLVQGPEAKKAKSDAVRMLGKKLSR